MAKFVDKGFSDGGILSTLVLQFVVAVVVWTIFSWYQRKPDARYGVFIRCGEFGFCSANRCVNKRGCSHCIGD